MSIHRGFEDELHRRIEGVPSEAEQIRNGERKGVQTVFIFFGLAIPFIFLVLATS